MSDAFVDTYAEYTSDSLEREYRRLHAEGDAIFETELRLRMIRHNLRTQLAEIAELDGGDYVTYKIIREHLETANAAADSEHMEIEKVIQNRSHRIGAIRWVAARRNITLPRL
jgi:hypothetical protein